MLWSCFSAAGTERLVRAEEKLSRQKYRDSLNEDPVQSIQNLRRAEGLPSNLNTQQEWRIHNSVNVLEWPRHSLSLNPIKHFWRNLNMCVCLDPTWQSLRGEETRRQRADNYPNLSYQTQKTWGCKCASTEYWVNEDLCNRLISVFINVQR